MRGYSRNDIHSALGGLGNQRLGGGLGRLALADYKPFVPVVANAYKARPLLEKAAIPSYRALIAHNDMMFDKLLGRVDVIFTDRDAYPDAKSMFRDIEENRRMYIWTGESDTHPIFTAEQNWRFRAVHDYIVHFAGGHLFTLRGEIGAYNRHAKILPPAAIPAIFTEIVGQLCVFFADGEKFGTQPQRAALIYGIDYYDVGLIEPEGYLKNFIPHAPGDVG